ncbi:Tenascin [Lucilia cuprina]|nr:Tenascin [Lucilia cuprina]
MYLKFLIIILFSIISVNSELRDIEEMYLNFFVQMESVKKSVDTIKVRLDVLSEKNPSNNCNSIDSKFLQVFQNFGYVIKSLDDLNNRLDNASQNERSSHQEVKYNTEQYEILQNAFIKSISEIKAKYSILLDELNAVKKSEEIHKRKTDDLEVKYSQILENYENIKKSNNDLKLEMKDLKEQISSIIAKDKAIENFEKKPIFDVRVDKLPEFKQYCYQDPAPVDCKTATKCTQKSGYYNITLAGKKAKQIMVFCDTQTNGGNWLHILRRHDGSENFSRPWMDYVKGFGQVDGEYWIGLENLHALTNYNGRQQLYVYIENFVGQCYSALYDDFVVGNASELYELKSLGKHYGLGEDDMSYNVGSKFSTIDKDNDSWPKGSCAVERQSGWWYTFCSYVQPTGQYFYNKPSGLGIVWRSFGGLGYSHKVMQLMIRNY